MARAGFPNLESPLASPNGRITTAWYRLLLDIFERTRALTGEVIIFTGAAAPAGTLLCNGAAVSRTIHAALFGVIGITFGPGDGVTTFNIPNVPPPFAGGVYVIYA